MANKFAKGEFVCKNPQKYMGKFPIIYRSSWEMTLMRVFDDHPNILGWSSESVSIPYQNPLTGRWSMYIPDFLVVYVDKDGKQHCEMIEVKPLKETPGYREKRTSQRTKLVQAINQAKWAAAMAYCHKRGWGFRVATEKDLFAYKRK
jgi:hypothetical protein